MTEGDFELKLLDLHWINNVDDPTDRCTNGHIFVKIGDEIVADNNNLLNFSAENLRIRKYPNWYQ